MAYSAANYWRLGAVYPRTALRQPYPMAVRTLVIPEQVGGQTIVLPPRVRAIETRRPAPAPRAYPIVTVTGGGSAPATPALAVADNRDGTGATATVTGSDAGTTERVYYGPPGHLGATFASRGGDGSLSLGPLADGIYTAQAVSLLGSLPSLPGPEVIFTVSGGAIAAASALALSKQKLITAIGNSATFQAAVGAAGAADALKSIYLAACLAKDEKEFARLRPFAVVGTAAELQYERDSGGTKNYLVASGAVYFYLTANDLDPTNPADSSVVWDNLLGGLIEDLEAVAALDDNLAIREMAIEGYGHSDEDRRQAQQPFWYALVRVEWGV